MRIALVSEQLDGGGAEGVVRRLAAGLAARGHQVFVYPLRRVPAALVDELRVAGVAVHPARGTQRSPALVARLLGWLHRDRVQVAQAHSCAALVHVLPAARLLRIPVVHVRHGWPPVPTRYHRVANRLMRFVDRVVINSEWLRDKLPAGRPSRESICIRNGIALLPTPPAQARALLEAACRRALRRPVVLSVANLRPEKDVCGLLEAFAILRHEWPTAQLVCIGAPLDPDYVHAVRVTAARLALEDHAFFPGPCPHAWRLLAGADVFCLSSVQESLPNVVLEAMTQRAPIVATAVGDVDRALLRHNVSGLLVPPRDPRALAAALAAVLRDPAAAASRAARAFDDYQAQFTTARMVREYERVYAKLAGRQSAPDPSGVTDSGRYWAPPGNSRLSNSTTLRTTISTVAGGATVSSTR